MEDACKKDIKQLTNLSTLLHLQLGFDLGILYEEFEDMDHPTWKNEKLKEVTK
jgi:hypothetical protein